MWRARTPTDLVRAGIAAEIIGEAISRADSVDESTVQTLTPRHGPDSRVLD